MIMAEAVLLILITLVNLALWLVFFIRFKKTFSPHVLLSDLKAEVDKLLIEINRTADQDITLVDSRIRDLKALIEEADHRLLLLERTENSRHRERRIMEKLAPSAVSESARLRDKKADTDSAVQLSIDFESYRVPHSEADEPINLSSLENVSSSDKTAPLRPAPDEPQIVYSADAVNADSRQNVPLKDRVVRMYAEGFSADIICERLKLSLTEVQLIIDLFAR